MLRQVHASNKCLPSTTHTHTHTHLGRLEAEEPAQLALRRCAPLPLRRSVRRRLVGRATRLAVLGAALSCCCCCCCRAAVARVQGEFAAQRSELVGVGDGRVCAAFEAAGVPQLAVPVVRVSAALQGGGKQIVQSGEVSRYIGMIACEVRRRRCSRDAGKLCSTGGARRGGAAGVDGSFHSKQFGKGEASSSACAGQQTGRPLGLGWRKWVACSPAWLPAGTGPPALRIIPPSPPAAAAAAAPLLQPPLPVASSTSSRALAALAALYAGASRATRIWLPAGTTYQHAASQTDRAPTFTPTCDCCTLCGRVTMW